MASTQDGDEDFNKGFILPPLIVQLGKILDQYPDDSQIFKELLQNAEDAGATTIKFLYDKKSYGTNKSYLQHPELAKYQGPALYAYNDGIFSDEDWKGIRMLSHSVKQNDPHKVGYFGMGFKSVFHITDMPIVLSGAKAGIIDPHKKAFDTSSHGWSLNRDQDLYETMPDQFEPFINVFDCSPDTFNKGFYSGTIFRFPLRQEPSPLSDKIYTADKMQGLMETFSEDAHLLLLFLRHVKTIELFERDQFDQDPKLVFKVLLSDINRDQVCRARKEFDEKTTYPMSAPLVSTYPISIETISTQDNKQLRETWSWLVTNYYVAGVSSAIFRKLQKDPDLNYQPWVGTAMPISSPNDTRSDGRVFCFLPLSSDQGSATGLPVHINGSFALEQNRKYLKWPSSRSYRSREELMDKKLMWNQCLLKEALPYAYAQMLLAAIKSLHKSPIAGLTLESVYKAFPDIRTVDRKWADILPVLLTEVSKHPVVYSQFGGGKWISITDAVFNTVDPSNDVYDVILKILEAGEIQVVSVPNHVHQALCNCSHIPIDKVTPEFVSSTFLKVQRSCSFLWEEKIKLLKFFLEHNQMTLLNGLKLLPLDNGEFQVFDDYYSKPQNIVYISDESDILSVFLPQMQNRFLHRDLEKDLYGLLHRAAQTGCKQLQKVDTSTFKILLPESLPPQWLNGAPSLWTPGENGHPPCHWLETLWDYLVKYFPLSLDCFEHLPLVPLSPVAGSSETQLVPLASKKVLMLREMDGICLGEGMENIVKELGLVVIEDMPDYIKVHPNVSHQYLFSPSYMGVIKALEKLEKVNGDGYVVEKLRKLLPEDKRTFLRLLAKISKYEMTSSHQQLLSRLPMFETVPGSGSSQSSFVSFSEVNITGPAAQFPVCTERLLDLKDAHSINLARVLGVQEVTEVEILTQMIFRDIERAMYDPEDVEKIMLRVIKHYQMYVDQDPSFKDILRSLPFMPRKDLLLTPDRFYDPDNEILQQMFYGQAMFPCGAYSDPSIVAVLSQIGLRGLPDVETEDILESAYCIQDMISDPAIDADLVCSKSDAILKYLLKYPMTLQDDCQGSTLGQSLLDVMWVKRLQEKPNFYPKCLTWFEGDRFYKPCDMVAKRNALLVGSVIPTVAIDLSDTVQEGLGWNTTPELDKIIQHLANAIKVFNHTEKAAFVEIVTSIYFRLDQYSLERVLTCLEANGLTEWIWQGNGFARPDNVFFHEAFMDLTPYVYCISGELLGFRDLFLSFGVKDHCNLPDVLKMIKERNEEQGHSSEVVVKRDLHLAISILNELKSQVADDVPMDLEDTLYMPVHESTSYFLKMALVKDCTYCDIEWIRQGFDLRDLEEGCEVRILLVHPNVPVSTSEALGVPTLMSRVLDAEELDYSFGQTDSLTHRLSVLLQEYTDGFAVPKEVIQNADDAGATEVKFLYDERMNLDARTCLIDEGMKECQGPALWAFNNAVFTDEDFENITKLSGATKEKHTEKIGRFGLGFNAVYNLTDVPSFVSRHNIVIFDPHTKYLGKSIKNKAKPGIKIDMRKHRNKLRRLDNQFKPYNDVFGCDLRAGSHQDSYPGTLFRFPLRTKNQAIHSDICQKHYDNHEVKLLLQMLVKKAENLLLFTQNVLKVSVYHLSAKAVSPLEANELFIIEKIPGSIIREPMHVSRHLPSTTGRLANAQHKMIQACSMLHASSSCMVKCRSGEVTDVEEMPRSSFIFDLQMKLSTECEVMLEITRTHTMQTWLLSYYMGNGEALNIALQDDSLLPIAGVAVQLSQVYEGIFQPVPIVKKRTADHDGTVFSFLPLPVHSGLAVHINAPFAVTPSRRHLCQKTEDDKYDVRSQWNNALLSGPVCQAYIQALRDVRSVSRASDYEYYDLWPKPDYCDPAFNLLVHGFYQVVGDADGENSSGLFSDGNNWRALSETYFLDPEYVTRDLGHASMAMFRSCIENDNQIVVESPSWVQESFDMADVGHLIKEQTLSAVQFIKDIVMPNIDHSDSHNREIIVLDALLSEDEELLSIIQNHACIPTTPLGKKLLKPKDLINPNVPMAALFSPADERFPNGAYASAKCLRILENLGMARDTLPWADITRIALQINDDWDLAYMRSRTCALLEFLNAKLIAMEGEEETEDQLICQEKLSEIPMFPLMQRPPWFPVSWVSDMRATNDLAKGNEIFSPDHCDLVCCLALVADASVFPVDGDRVKNFLGLKNKDPGYDMVVKQLDMLTCSDAEEALVDRAVLKQLSHMCFQIYQYLQDRCLEKVSKKKIQALLKERRFILSKRQFVTPQQITFEFPYNCEPYLHGLPDNLKNSFSLLMEAAGVRNEFSTRDYVQALQRMRDDFKDLELDRDQLKLALQLVNLLNDSMEDLDQTLTEVVDEHGTIYIPDAGNVLRSASGLCFNEPDCPWLPPSQHSNYSHPNIPFSISKQLGVNTKRQEVLKKHSRGIPFGQRERLTNRLKRILSSYPCDKEILKELLQNADDASASEMHFIKDSRQHGTDRVFEDSWKPLQGPALCVYNDRPFTEADIEGIQRLGEGSKGTDPNKTGQYGIGFNCVYHLTDVPSFLTQGEHFGETLCVFDPHGRFVPGASVEEPGRRYDDVSELRHIFTDVFPCYMEDKFPLKNSTMFRFPLRTDEMAEKSELSEQVITTQTIDELFSKFKAELFDCVIFVNNIATISLTEIGQLTRRLTNTYKVTVEVEHGLSQREAFMKHVKKYSSKVKAGTLKLWDIPLQDVTYVLKISDNKGRWEKWMVSQQIGFDGSYHPTQALKDAFARQELAMLPRGGVAALIDASSAVAYQRAHKAFCFLPLPVKTDLSVHINGHFALESEARRNIWMDDESGPKAEWNQLLISNVIAPAYVTMLQNAPPLLSPPDLNLSNLSMNGGSAWDMPEIEKYGELFPNLASTTAEPWRTLALCVYKHIHSAKVAVLPVLRPSFDTSSSHSSVSDVSDSQTEWLPTNGLGRNGPYFDTLGSYVADDQDLTFSGITTRRKVMTSTPKKKASRDTLRQVLLSIGFKLVKLPIFVYEGFDAAGIDIECISPRAVVDFLASYSSKNSHCFIGTLPCDIHDTLLHSVNTLQVILGYCVSSESYYFYSNLEGLPLLLSEDGQLRQFSSTDRIYLTSYHDLLPGLESNFMHHTLSNTIFKDIDIETNLVFDRFDIPAFARLLPNVLPASRFKVGKQHEAWPVDGDSLIDAKWLWQLWSFLKHEYGRLVLDPGHDEELLLDKVLEPLKDWSLLPAVVPQLSGRMSGYRMTDSDDAEHYLVPIGLAGTIIDYTETSIMSYPAKDCLKALRIPELDCRTLDGGQMSPVGKNASPVSCNSHLAKQLVASLEKPKTVLLALHFALNRLSQRTVTLDGCFTLCKYYNDTADTWNDDTEAQVLLRRLPVFHTVTGSISDLGKNEVFVLPSDIPKTDTSRLESVQNITLLSEHSNMTELYKALKCKILTFTEAYVRFIFPSFPYLSKQSQEEHLLYIKDTRLSHLQDSEKSQIIEGLKMLEFLQDRDGFVRKASEFYDPHHPVFKVMLDHGGSQFPPPPFNDFKWLDFLRRIGLQHVVSAELFIHFANEVAYEAKHAPSEDTLHKAHKLVTHLFKTHNLHLQNLLEDLRDIPFIPAAKVNTTLQKICAPFAKPDEEGIPPYISFNAGVPEQHEILAWTSSSLLPGWANPFKLVESSASFSVPDDPEFNLQKYQKSIASCLGVNAYPTVATVVSHMQNVCSANVSKDPNMNDLQAYLKMDVMKKVYRFLLGEVERQETAINLKELNEIPCIVIDLGRALVRPKQVVINLYEEDQIVPYLYKAPTELGEFKSLFVNLGATLSVTCDQYAMVLEKIYMETDGDKLHPNEMRLVFRAVYGLFKALQKHKSQGITMTTLYLPSSSGRLVQSTDLVFIDDYSFHERIPLFDRPFLVDLRECGLKSENFTHIVKMLPKNLCPLLLTSLVEEKLDSGSRNQLHIHGISEKLRYQLSSKAFAQAIERLIKHEHKKSGHKVKEDVLSEIQQKLKRVMVFGSDQLFTFLSYQKKRISGSESESLCFADKRVDDTEVDAWTICINSSVGFSEELLVSIAVVINKVIGGLLSHSVHYIQPILTCSPYSISKVLDKLRVRPDHSADSHQTTLPTPGSFIPVDDHHLLDEAFSDFEMGEFVGYELDDDETGGRIIVYAVIARKVDHKLEEENSDATVFTQEFDINVGDDRPHIHASSTDLYKFARVEGFVARTSSIPESTRSFSDTTQSTPSTPHPKYRQSFYESPMFEPQSPMQEKTKPRPQNGSLPEQPSTESKDHLQPQSDPYHNTTHVHERNKHSYQQESVIITENGNNIGTSLEKSTNRRPFIQRPPQTTAEEDTEDVNISDEAKEVEAIMNEVSDAMEEAWKLPAKQKKKVMKRLLLKWHPDKNIGNEDFATIITQHVHSELERLELGLPRASKMSDFSFDPRNPFARDEKFQANFYKAYQFFFEQMNRRAKEHKEQRQRYKENFSREYNAQGDYNFDVPPTFSSSNPQPAQAKRFLRQAQEDLRAADNDYEVKEPAYEWVCFKGHQAAEKALKAAQFFVDAGTSFSHDLVTLAACIEDLELRRLAQRLQGIVGNSNKLYNPDPIDFVVIPHEEYTRDMACDVVVCAADILERVKEFVDTKE